MKLIANLRSLPTRALYENFGGPLTDRTRLQKVSPQRLWDVVLDRRAKDVALGENPITTKALAAARQAGLEDPLEITPEATEHVRALFARYHPVNEVDKTMLLLRSVMMAGNYPIVDGKLDKQYYGFWPEEGGLNIPGGQAPGNPLRSKHGALLPKILLQALPKERIAVCLEYGTLLMVMLRQAGINAYMRIESRPQVDHGYVVAQLDGKQFKLDSEHWEFEATELKINADREILAQYYSVKGYFLFKQHKLREAELCYEQALELNPRDSEAWNNKGKLYLHLEKLDEAVGYFDRAIALKPNYAAAHNGRGEALVKSDRLDEAMFCFTRAIETDVNYVKARENLGEAFKLKGDLSMAEFHLALAKRLREYLFIG